jgi:hypothetical protein
MMGYLSETKLLLTMLKHEGMVFLRTGCSDNCASKDCPYTIECEGLDINTIAYNLDQLEDSVLVCYHGDKPEDDGDTEWIRLVYGNSYGELVADYSMGLDDKFAHLFDYMDLEFEEIMQNMGYENIDVVDLIDENKRLREGIEKAVKLLNTDANATRELLKEMLE